MTLHTKYTDGFQKNRRRPILGCLLGKIHGFCPPNRTYPPWPHFRYPLTSTDEDPNSKKLLGRVAHGSGGHYCFISPIQHIMHYFTQNMPTTPLQQETPILGCLLMEIHGFCPPNRTYPPWPHLRYPLTSKDEDPNNKKLLGRVAHERRGQYCFISLTQDTMHYFT